MSEHITHAAVYEDGVRLALHGGVLGARAEESLRRYYDAGFCASSARGNRFYVVPFLEEARRQRPASAGEAEGGAGEEDAYAGRLIAAALGWLTHRAADFTLDDAQVPLLDELREEEGLSEDALTIVEHQIYHDAVLFDKVYDGGRLEPQTPHAPFSPSTLSYHMESHAGAEAVDVEGVELLFGALWQRNLLQLHRFTDREDDFEAWLDSFLERRQAFVEDMRIFTDAHQEPDPEAMQYYIEALNFYDEADPVIQLARALQRGEAPPETGVEEAVEAAAAQSVYAQGLGVAYRNLQMGNDLLEGAISKTEMYDYLEVGEHNRY